MRIARWVCFLQTQQVTLSLTHSLSQSRYFYFWHSKSDPWDLWLLRHLITVMRRPETILKTNKIFDNVCHFWQFSTILTKLDDFWQLKPFLTSWIWKFGNFVVLTILTTFDNFDNDNDYPRDLRHWLQFWQLKTWIRDNLCDLTIKSDTGQHSQFLPCSFGSLYFVKHNIWFLKWKTC